VNTIVEGDALQTLRFLPSECIALIVTSPPYWNTVDYEVEGQIGQTSYEDYLAELLDVWKEAARLLIPNGKLAIVTPIMPIRKEVIPDQYTRHIKNINNDIERTILESISELKRYGLFVWQKQTTEKMFGSYPHPPNIYENNTIEFISVYVKDGPPPVMRANAKDPSKLTQEQWLNLTMQVWPIYPEDVKRSGGHPCPFPVALPQRLIMMYTFKRCDDAGFAGDIVLDMFNGTGATCVAAKSTGRNWIGIDLNPGYCEIARHRVKYETTTEANMMLERIRVKAPVSSSQLSFELQEQQGNSDPGSAIESK
jgi:DNA modification methylase